MKFIIKDNEQYQPCLWRLEGLQSEDDSELVLQRLWNVQLFDPKLQRHMPHIHVLASGEKEAISQAECLYREVPYEFHTDEHKKQVLEKSKVTSVPFLIRGWGKQLF